MNNCNENVVSFPSIEQLELELKRIKKHKRRGAFIRKIFFIIFCIAAILVFVTAVVSPVLRVTGDNMNPTLNDGDVIVLIKTDTLKRGDICAFKYHDKLLIKRVIGVPGDEVNIDENGTFFINGKELNDSCGAVKAMGVINIELPYKVDENTYFVVGDNRSKSIDSRYFGSIASEDIIGKAVVQIWPLSDLKLFSN